MFSSGLGGMFNGGMPNIGGGLFGGGSLTPGLIGAGNINLAGFVPPPQTIAKPIVTPSNRTDTKPKPFNPPPVDPISSIFGKPLDPPIIDKVPIRDTTTVISGLIPRIGIPITEPSRPNEPAHNPTNVGDSGQRAKPPTMPDGSKVINHMGWSELSQTQKMIILGGGALLIVVLMKK